MDKVRSRRAKDSDLLVEKDLKNDSLRVGIKCKGRTDTVVARNEIVNTYT